MAEKVTVMVLKVDLQCASCYKKVKRVLCKFPREPLTFLLIHMHVLRLLHIYIYGNFLKRIKYEPSSLVSMTTVRPVAKDYMATATGRTVAIDTKNDSSSLVRFLRDQVYDEKANTVIITVVCCSPEKIRDKLCFRGAKAIKSIEIKETPKPKAVLQKPKDPEKPKPAPEKPKPPPEKPVEKAKDPTPAPVPVPAPAPAMAPIAPQPVPVNFFEQVHGYPHMHMYPTGIFCGPCSEGYGVGPCYHEYGRPIPQALGPYYDEYGGYGYEYEENPQGCTIM